MSANFENDPEFADAIPKPGSGRGFTLVELIVVLGIFVLLIALLFPWATCCDWTAARRAQCESNLKQIAIALLSHEQVHNALPPAYTVDAKGRRLHSWRTLILPYLEQESLYHTIDLSKPWNDSANAKALETSLSVFRCPEAVGPIYRTNYLAIASSYGCLNLNEPRRLAEITDAHGSTLMVIETGQENAVPWMAPVDADESLVMSLGPTTRLHQAGGMNACFVDGHVTYLKANVPAVVLRALMSIAGNDNEFANKLR